MGLGELDLHLAGEGRHERIYELLEGHPNQFFVLYNLGRAYEELHRYDLAIQMYRRYLDEGGLCATVAVLGAGDLADLSHAHEHLQATAKALSDELGGPGADV